MLEELGNGGRVRLKYLCATLPVLLADGVVAWVVSRMSLGKRADLIRAIGTRVVAGRQGEECQVTTCILVGGVEGCARLCELAWAWVTGGREVCACEPGSLRVRSRLALVKLSRCSAAAFSNRESKTHCQDSSRGGVGAGRGVGCGRFLSERLGCRQDVRSGWWYLAFLFAFLVPT